MGRQTSLVIVQATQEPYVQPSWWLGRGKAIQTMQANLVQRNNTLGSTFFEKIMVQLKIGVIEGKNMPRSKSDKPHQIESKGHVVDSAIQSSLLELVALGQGTEFTADCLYRRLTQKIPVEKLKGLLARKVGLSLRRMKALKIISQTPRAIKSERSSALVQVWCVGSTNSNETKAGPVLDASASSKALKVQRKAKKNTPLV